MSTPALESLAEETRALDAPPPVEPPPGAPPGAPGLQRTPGQEWAMVPMMFGRILGRFFPEVKDIYSEQANLEWGEAMAPVALELGWTVEKFMAWLGPRVVLVLASEALLTPTAQVLWKKAQEMRAARAAAKAAAPAPAPAPAAPAPAPAPASPAPSKAANE